MDQQRAPDEKQHTMRKLNPVQAPEKDLARGTATERPDVTHLQQQAGNRAVQRLLAQRSADGSFELDDATASQIHSARGGGHPLDSVIQKQMGKSMGHDFGRVRVHTSSEADNLSQQLSAKAFTTGQDIFFRQGAYDPGSTGGQELIAHELTHVVQQSSGLVGGGPGMTVRPAGDAYEQEADSIAKMTDTAGAQVQRQAEEEEVQMQVEEEEETLQMQALQRQEVPEEELQMQVEEEEEDLQMQALEEEEEMLSA